MTLLTKIAQRSVINHLHLNRFNLNSDDKIDEVCGTLIITIVFPCFRCKISACEYSPNESIIWTQYAIPQDKKGLSKCIQYSYRDGIALDNKTICSSDLFNTSRIEACSSFVYSDQDSAVIDVSIISCCVSLKLVPSIKTYLRPRPRQNQ